jgi:GMP synthase (glutamine-hydrolysing)
MAHLLVVNNAEPGIREFAMPIEEIIDDHGSSFDFIEYRQCFKTEFNRYDGIILTGSPRGDDIVEHHSPFFEWIKNCKRPILGICAGHHITGFLYGAEILRSVEPESGDFEILLLERDAIFIGLQSVVKVKQMHNDSITLPEGFILLATSKTCKNQMMKHKFKTIYTTQFHPEFYNKEIIRNFIQICENHI